MGPTLERLKTQIEKSPRDARGHRRYSARVKDAARRYAARRIEEGLTQRDVGRELGVSGDTMWGWLQRSDGAAGKEGEAAARRAGFPAAAIEVRGAIAALGERGPTTPYPAELRAKALAYLQERQAAGGSLRVVASELMIGADSLRKWQGAQAPMVRPVSVVPDRAASALVVHGPNGIRIEGLDVSAVARLLKELSC